MVRFGEGSRRNFLNDLFGEWAERTLKAAEARVQTERFQRPPGATTPEVAFLAACTRCSACVEACPVGAIRIAPARAGFAAGTPYLDLNRQPCVACPDMPCAASCPTDALNIPEHGWQGERLGVLELVPERCVTFHGSECRACVDACPIGERALIQDEQGHPSIRAEGCVGCGVCVRACITSPSSMLLSPLER